MQSGEADAGVTSKDFGNLYKTDYRLVNTNIVFQPSSLFFAFPKGSGMAAQLIERIDYRVRELKADRDSIYYQSLENWMGIGRGEKTVVPMWLIGILAGIGALSCLFIGWWFILRAQVKSRTKELTGEIARREKADEELARYHTGLEALVKQRTAELEQANIHLQEMDRLKSVFLASMSHELRTPLNSIIGFTGIMLMGMSGELDDEQKKQLGMVKNNASHLLSLINDVLDISKIEAERIEFNLEEFRLVDAVNEVVEPLLPSSKSKELEIITDIPGNITLLHDRRRVKQIIMNLVSNAIKFTDRGSVKITANINGDGRLEIHVIDTGVGIKQGEISKLFQPFQQVGASFTKKYEGTGLGLYLSGKLISLMGGSISVKSEYERGSEFISTLPLRYKEGNPK